MWIGNVSDDNILRIVHYAERDTNLYFDRPEKKTPK